MPEEKSSESEEKLLAHWVNLTLANDAPHVRVANLCDDLRDGRILMLLLLKLSSQTNSPKWHHNLATQFLDRQQRLALVQECFDLAEHFLRAKIISISPADIVNGNTRAIVGLVRLLLAAIR